MPADLPLETLGARVSRLLGGPPRPPALSGSGPVIARLFDRVLAAIFLVAWISLGSQIDLLAGRRGLLPVEGVVSSLRAMDASFLDVPTLFTWTGASDAALHAGIGAGVVLAVLAFAGVFPRICFALSTVLYLSYATGCRVFLSFQWDNMLLECGVLAALLPRDRRAPWAHLLLRVLLFKLYFESGIAKWYSPLGDWQDGSAMTFYYETAPIPARLAWYAHALPAWWHHFESRWTLFFELVVPLAIFGPRRLRYAALAVFTAFQIVDLATANYGFFCYLSLALHLFLLDEGDVRALRGRLEKRFAWLHRWRAHARLFDLRVRRALRRIAIPKPARRAGAIAVVGGYLLVSLSDAVAHFASARDLVEALAPIRKPFAPLRIVNTYHLFAAITRERIEPELQTFDGAEWKAHDLFYKPGDITRAPVIVAPHQPRVDFQLWFYGLGHQRGAPAWVAALLERACRDQAVIQPLFPERLPDKPLSARMAFFRYRFTSPEERRRAGAWWKREWLDATRPLACAR
jgi:hypothetical protein